MSITNTQTVDKKEWLNANSFLLVFDKFHLR